MLSHSIARFIRSIFFTKKAHKRGRFFLPMELFGANKQIQLLNQIRSSKEPQWLESKRPFFLLFLLYTYYKNVKIGIYLRYALLFDNIESYLFEGYTLAKIKA